MKTLWILVLGIVFGILLGRSLESGRRTRSVVTVERRRDPAPPGSPVVQKARQPDDLTAIEGIGPAFEKALNALGIYLFADLARQNPEDLAARLTARVTADRIRRDQWIEQAQAKADEQA